MAAGGSDAYASIRHAGSTAHERGPAGPVVAFCRGDRCVGSRVGMATARGPALMGGALWERLARVFGRSARERSEAERILLEADFGVEATEEILDRVSGAKDGDHDFRSALERAVIGALTPAAPSVAPGALAHAPAPPTVILVFGVNGVGKTTAVAKLGARLAHEGRSVLFAAADTFRAGAAEQLQVWADRLGVPCITGTKDPAAVAFERAVEVPIRFLGTGEGLGDLEVFAAERFARRLIGG